MERGGHGTPVLSHDSATGYLGLHPQFDSQHHIGPIQIVLTKLKTDSAKCWAIMFATPPKKKTIITISLAIKKKIYRQLDKANLVEF